MRRRTLAAPSARIELYQEFKLPHGESPRLRGLRGMVLRLASRTVKLVARAWWRHATRRRDPTRALELGQMLGKGIAEPAQGRYMIDYGSHAQIHTRGKTFGGRSGRSLHTLHPLPGRRQVGDVLWLLKLLRGTIEAAVEGTDTLHGTVCRRLAAHVDLEQASAATEEGLESPHVDRFEELRALPVTVWIDGEHVRRLRFEQVGPPSTPRTLDLWEFGVPADELDWSRLPTFRSPRYQRGPKPWYQRILLRFSRVRYTGLG
jgi:hypothetical protein